MTELEEQIRPLLLNGTLKFYGRYVDDMLVLIKSDDIKKVLKQLNSFDKNLTFTVDRFENETPHFLDILINESRTDIFCKSTHTGQYTHFTSFEPWKYKIAWIRKILSGLHEKHDPDKKINEEKESCAEANVPTIWFRIPYPGRQGEKLVKQCIRKFKRRTNPLTLTLATKPKECLIFVLLKTKHPRISVRMSSINSNVLDVTPHILGKQIDALNSDWKNTVVNKVVQRFITTSSTASTSNL